MQWLWFVLGATVVAGLAIWFRWLWKRRLEQRRQLTRLSAALRRDAVEEALSLPAGDDEVGQLVSLLQRYLFGVIDRQRMLERHLETAELILDTISTGILLVDSHGRVVLYNTEFVRFCNADREASYVGKPHIELTQSYRLSQAIEETLRSREDHTFEFVPPARQGRWYVVECRPAQVEGSRAGAVISVRDVTEQRRLDRLRRDFVANVSHELRTPVTSIRGFAETLLDGGVEEPDEARRFIAIIAREATRLSAMVEDLLQLARLESEQVRTEYEPIDIAHLVGDIANELQYRAEEQGVSLQVAVQPVMAEADVHLVRQIVTNLVDNAIKYTPPGGSVRLEAEQLMRSGKPGAQISVIDTGRGIPRDQLDRIFERFYRVESGRERLPEPALSEREQASPGRRPGGTGLGLAIVRHAVDLHHGLVSVDSEPGKGSTFRVWIPQAQPQDEGYHAAYPRGVEIE